MSRPFSHLDPGTAEEHWQDELRRRPIELLDDDIDLLVVVAAHPDDETLGAAGLMSRTAGRGIPVIVVIATDGEGSHPASPTSSPEDLAERRRIETARAVSIVAPGSDIHFLGLPDGQLEQRSGNLRDALAGIVEGASAAPDRMLVVAPWSGDGHRDHRITAEACDAVCDPRGIRRAHYPIWAWHWGTADDLPWALSRAVRLDGWETAAKRRAIASHTTQIAPLSDQPGDETLLHARMVSHFERDVEVFVLGEERLAERDKGSLDAAYFDAFYARNGDDPWGFESRWYEERKREILLASLPDRSLGAVLEVGCATGVLTERLAARADSVLAMDAAHAAVRRAQERVGTDPRVTVRVGAAPGDWPEGEFDTIVLSEVGYYLSSADLRNLRERVAGSLTDQGCVVACHWRHPVRDYPLSGDDVHDILSEDPSWRTLVSHREHDFRLEVFAPAARESVAQREGLA
ncbi:bifunctional PIG-L family deacetylase/class I SAM-dependent methyltransferase [Microbacterium insulae]|uniref:Bifunctional PIG-L family deacetylase/class I SAM-dependent methyltransferase n=1 Tax=Microbacterium insulae TaxID=483014 RepID=A0ABW3AEX5_9MICO